MTDLDYSAARMVRELCDELTRSGVTLLFGRVSDYLRADMDRHGIAAAIGARRIFPTMHEAVEAVRAHERDARKEPER